MSGSEKQSDGPQEQHQIMAERQARANEIESFLKAIELMRLLHADAKVRWLSELLSIALNEGETTNYYCDKLFIKQPMAWKDFAALGNGRKYFTNGIGLIDARLDKMSGHIPRNRLYLTDCGRDLINIMIETLKGPVHSSEI